MVEERGGAVEAGRSAVGSGLLLVARLVMLAAYVLAGVIVAAILLFLLGANPDNSIVEAVHDAGSALAGPFKDMFEIERAKVAMTVNWGLGALAYLVVGAIVAGILRNLAPRTYV